ncbi:FFLEELY motif protein [Alteromonas sp. CYL-A6]|uniref:FFLEELY motif protein n=1 Tax=Alteromonas nitratireducens TaxID=3390813 RepID=UPI0034BBDBC2
MSSAIIGHLHQVNAYRDLAEKMGLTQAIAQLQEWQCQRLLATHDDLARQPKYQLAMGFFVDELYGPKDFSQRDADLARVIPKLARVLPDKAMNALDDALSLNALSYDLDMKMSQRLRELCREDTVIINRTNYAQAYRDVGEPDKRARQIEIITHLGDQLAEVINIRGIGMLIKLARKPAQLAGLLTLHEFLERGFNAFKAIGDVHSFIDPVLTRERDIMQMLFSESFDPETGNPLPDV